MPRYELGILCTATGAGAAAAELVAGSNRPMSILEIGVTLSVATAVTYELGRPGNTPAGGTSQTATEPTNQPPGGAASVGGIILSGWTTAPTISAAGNKHRRVALPAAVGNGMILGTWAYGELIVGPTRSDGLIIWQTANSPPNLYVKWEE